MVVDDAIRLEPFLKSDFDRLISWVDSEEFMYQFAGPVFTYPITHRQLEIYCASETRRVFKVLMVESSEVIGHCEIGKIDTHNHCARLCRILIGVEYHRNKGLGAKIIKALCNIGFDELGLHRIDLGVFEFNLQAIRCYEKCGFKIEGLLRESFRIYNEYHSVYNMSLLRTEWNDR